MQADGNAPTVTEPEDRTPEQIAADIAWLRELRARVNARWGVVVGGHDAHLDTLETR
jgi:hypothetical protein